MREQWLHEQFSTIDVNDKRLRRRAVDIAISCAEQPEESLAGRFDDWADLKAVYRFFSHPKITHQVLQEPHWHQVLEKACWSEATEILGLGYQETWVRPEEKSARDSKESEVWLRALEKMGRPQKNWISVSDR
ncbi:MAG TPA: transposase DNA-binding-containing protein, partial [Rhabdochlamydiaceae bacterium]|nr:transposase DNA-binding-containing protein [Rhabdochlamydiaceae bacterium]